MVGRDRQKDEEKTEDDVEDDEHVARSRAGKSGGDDGTYVGQSASDDTFDAGQTGAEARSRDQDR